MTDAAGKKNQHLKLGIDFVHYVLKSVAGFGTDHYLEAYGIATRTLVENLGLDTPTLRD